MAKMKQLGFQMKLKKKLKKSFHTIMLQFWLEPFSKLENLKKGFLKLECLIEF